ncbi:Sulfate transporter 1.2 [Melia azedarach]|uniref:Sulfate transporter 1.2 n=1 Tax=Melia azedarach TaxID=155640 RepID=A0ACC1YCR1_MELAZ|nr:Sulfate transporter 1.2 [Melia azedarach]
MMKMINAAACGERELEALWAESDARFLRRLIMAEEYDDQKKHEGLPSLVYEGSESIKRFRSRQIFLRSYPFDKEKTIDTITQRTKKWLKMAKENAKNGGSSSLKACMKLLLSCTVRIDVVYPLETN